MSFASMQGDLRKVYKHVPLCAFHAPQPLCWLSWWTPPTTCFQFLKFCLLWVTTNPCNAKGLGQSSWKVAHQK